MKYLFTSNNVTGPPEALLFDVKPEITLNNHYNCYFVQLAAWGIYCTDVLNFLSHLTPQVKHPMQLMAYDNTL